MKHLPLILAAFASSLLPSCISFVARDSSVCEPNVYVAPGTEALLSAPSVSYSISFINNTGHRSMSARVMIPKAKEMVRKRLEECGLFRVCYYADIERASDYHLHFTFEESEDFTASAAFSVLSLGMLPGLQTQELNASLSLLLRGKELDILHTKWNMHNITWLPLIVLAPFLYDEDALLENAVEKLLRDLKAENQ